MPVRVPSNRGGNIIGSFPSLKMPPNVAYESTIERDLLFFLEYDPTVHAYYPQPFTISHTDLDGTSHTYTPDFQVIRATGKELVECKPAALVSDDVAQRQIRIGQTWASANDHMFVVITDIDLRSGHQLANLKLLWRYARTPIPIDVPTRCRALLEHNPDGLPFGILASTLAGTSSMIHAPHLYALLFRNILRTNMHQPLTTTSLIRLPC
ncbi:hypothetical protein F8S13_03390 [Chloroflexia bacterium SDU3-3]|nr:hypothetical protein F8S13_03390 [Chloroflexia bacterium SDU3-3]